MFNEINNDCVQLPAGAKLYESSISNTMILYLPKDLSSKQIIAICHVLNRKDKEKKTVVLLNVPYCKVEFHSVHGNYKHFHFIDPDSKKAINLKAFVRLYIPCRNYLTIFVRATTQQAPELLHITANFYKKDVTSFNFEKRKENSVIWNDLDHVVYLNSNQKIMFDE